MKLVIIIDDKRVRDEMASIQSKTKEPISVFEAEGKFTPIGGFTPIFETKKKIYSVWKWVESEEKGEKVWTLTIDIENASLQFITYNIEFIKIFMQKSKKGLPVKFGYAYLGKPLPVIVYVYA